MKKMPIFPSAAQAPRVALASQSPRRKAILEQFGFGVEVVVSGFDETMLSRRLAPEDYVVAAARGKALGAAHSLPIVAGDTIVVLDNEIFGKPSDPAAAAAMLGHLSGRTHEVLGASVLRVGTRMTEALDRSRVTFRPMSAEEIAAYVASEEPMGKAGAYAIQGLGSLLVKEFSGSYWNIVGFPIEAFLEMWRAGQ
jgi:septum formation protein